MKKRLILVLVLSLVLASMNIGAFAAPKTEVYDFSVVFTGNDIPDDFERLVKRNGGQVVTMIDEIGYAAIQADMALVDLLQKNQGVKSISPTMTWAMPEMKSVDYEQALSTSKSNGKAPKGKKFVEEEAQATVPALWGIQWDIQRITQNGAAYTYGTGSHDVVVGIIDSGVDVDHPDLVKNLLPGSKNFVPKDETRFGEVDINDIQDLGGHGSHVAGSIAGNGAIYGVAPDIGFRSYRVFGTGGAYSDWIINAIVAATNDGVDVINMSLGGFDIIGQVFYVNPETGEKENLGNDVADFIAYKRAVQYATKNNVVVVVAAGNDAMNCTNKSEVTDFLNAEYGGDGYYFVGAGFNVPASYPGVITVSASGPQDELALYSNYGPGFIDMAAPGGNYDMMLQYDAEGRYDEYINNKLYYQEFCLSSAEDGGYVFMVGTSMAAPKVAAAAALVIDKYGDIPNHEVLKILQDSSDQVSGTDSIFFGQGYLNTFNMMSK